MKARDGEKFCPGCKRTLGVSDFGKNRCASDGLAWHCRRCMSEHGLRWRLRKKAEAEEAAVELDARAEQDQALRDKKAQAALDALRANREACTQ